jgi:hypothetical protein
VLIRGVIRHSDELSASATLDELREIVRDITHRLAMLEVEAAGRQAILTGGKDDADVEDVEDE